MTQRHALPLALLFALTALAACNAPPAKSQDEVKVDGKTAAEWEAEADKDLAAANAQGGQPAANTPAEAPAAITDGPAPATVGAAISPGHYQCTIFVGYLQNSPGFTINSDGSYSHEQGSVGRVTLDATGLVLFSGGALDGQAAKYEIDGGGRPTIRLYNESRSRTVIDCQQ